MSFMRNLSNAVKVNVGPFLRFGNVRVKLFIFKMD